MTVVERGTHRRKLFSGTKAEPSRSGPAVLSRLAWRVCLAVCLFCTPCHHPPPGPCSPCPGQTWDQMAEHLEAEGAL